eukprot:1369189-Rhodomonas_salina.1
MPVIDVHGRALLDLPHVQPMSQRLQVLRVDLVRACARSVPDLAHHALGQYRTLRSRRLACARSVPNSA